MSNSQGSDPQGAQIICAASCTLIGAVLTVNKQRGCVVARTGVGVYTVTILPVIVNPGQDMPVQNGNLAGAGIPTNSFVAEIQQTGNGAAGSQIQVANTSDTVKTITIFTVVPAAVDQSFEFIFKKVSPT